MRHSLILILLLTLTACGLFSTPDDKGASKSAPVEKLYADAMDEMNDNNYEKAVKSFETLQSRFPYGRYAQQADLEIAYANFKQKEPDAALVATDRFIKQYPNNPHVDYAYYLKGLVNFNEDYGILFVLLQYFGILPLQGQKTSKRILAFIVPVILHLHFIDYLTMTLQYVNEDWFKWKIELAWIISLAVRLLVWHTLRRKSENVINTM